MKKFFLIVLVACLSLQVSAWDAVGHRIVADIAYRNLTKKARKQVDSVLGTRGIVYYSSWADEIKSDTIYPHSSAWHFQNMNAGLTHADIDSLYHNKLADGEHLFYAMDSLVRVLKQNGADADALKFIVHLAGDEYQPMHMGHAGDLGGNRVQMTWFGQHTNLHAVWDRWLLDYTQYSYTEFADFLCDRYDAQKDSILQLSELECLYRTYDAVTAVYDAQASVVNASKRYEYRYYYCLHGVMEYQLYVAGIRLSMLLNEIYK